MLNIGIKSNKIIWYLVGCLFIFAFQILPLVVTAKHLSQSGIYHLGGTDVLLSVY